MRGNETRTLSKTAAETDSSCIAGLRVGPDATEPQRKTPAENILFDISRSSIVLDPYPKGNKMKTKLGLIKLKRICTAKETTEQMERQLTECGRISADGVPIGLVFSTCNSSHSPAPKQQTNHNQTEQWADTEDGTAGWHHGPDGRESE